MEIESVAYSARLTFDVHLIELQNSTLRKDETSFIPFLSHRIMASDSKHIVVSPEARQ